MSVSLGDELHLRPMAHDDLELVLAWRNHPSVVVGMISQHMIAPEEHASWYERSIALPTRCLLIATRGTTPIGFAQLNWSAEDLVADWGFYVAPASQSGTGFAICACVVAHAFTVLKLHKICGRVIDGNTRSLRLHERLGFKTEGVLRQQCLIRGQWHDLACFGLLREEWQRRNLGAVKC
jgi:UDP-4-amino-4,6-dideoxy-N-acetyl-beta-L-altrosamine N-acetyltransferase